MAVWLHHAHNILKPAQTLDLIKTAATVSYPSIKKYPLPLSTTFLSIFILTKCPKAPFYKALKENMKHKTDEKEEEDILYVYTQKEVRKPLLYLAPKKLKMPIL